MGDVGRLALELGQLPTDLVEMGDEWLEVMFGLVEERSRQAEREKLRQRNNRR